MMARVCTHGKINRNRNIHLFICKNYGYKPNAGRIVAMHLDRMGIKYLIQLQLSRFLS